MSHDNHVTIVIDAEASGPKAESQAHPDITQELSGDPCLGCAKHPVEFMANGCRHPLFCKKCAMKCASGGKCKVCHQWYANLERIR